MTKNLIASLFVSFFVVACAAEDAGSLNGGRGGGGENGTTGDPNAPGADGTQPGAEGTTDPGAMAEPACQGKPHIGFANVDFVADRKAGELGENRRRVKPYSALRSEFTRAIGATPTQLALNAAAFGDTPARWYNEPVQGAVSLYTMYTLGFTTCYDTMTQPEFQVAPTAATATDQCTKLARKIWQRTPTTEEAAACSDLVLSNTTETNARRRWAHGCASLLTATGFTTY